ncbi:hypothetical protein [Bailinhaonella thermotolerans]|nr:hypothetical protein [Bailinhaonella thermotolerans]
MNLTHAQTFTAPVPGHDRAEHLRAAALSPWGRPGARTRPYGSGPAGF